MTTGDPPYCGTCRQYLWPSRWPPYQCVCGCTSTPADVFDRKIEKSYEPTFEITERDSERFRLRIEEFVDNERKLQQQIVDLTNDCNRWIKRIKFLENTLDSIRKIL